MKKKEIFFPIRITIILSFFLTFFCVVTIITFYNYYRSSRQALLTAEQLMESQSQQIFMKVENLYKPMSYLAEQASALPSIGEKPSLQTHKAEEYMLNVMKIYQQIQIQYIGFQDGDFYCIYSISPGSGNSAENLHAPKDASFAILRQYTPENRAKPVRLWRYLNDKDQTIGSYKEETVSYDPRSRVWYKNAIETDGIIKSEPYIFDSSKRLGVTVSTRLDGNIPCVYGVDLFISDVSKFLEDVRDYDGQVLAIFNSDMRITAGLPGNIELSGTDQLKYMKDSGSDLLVRVAERLEETDDIDDMTFTLKLEENSFLVRIMEIPDQYTNKEYILIAIPRNEILGPIAQNTRLIILYSFILFLLFIPIIFIIASKISNPITKLATEAELIQKHDFSKDITLKSGIQEIHSLIREMAVMKRGLRHFNKYVSSKLVKHLLESNTEPEIGGSLRHMTILFTDIVSFTSISEQMEPEVLMQHLSHYFDKVTNIIRRNNGIVDKYIGDAVMAFWNAPYNDPSHVVNACRAAIEINKTLNREKTDADGLLFKTRIGLDTGEVVVGNVGDSDRMNYTVIGDVVNNSSRLEGVNKLYHTSILISDKVVEYVEDDFLICPVARIIVMGKTIAQDIYELIDLRSEANDIEEEFVFHFSKAFRLYYERDWMGAEREFLEADHLMHRDNTWRFIESCRELIAAPPGDDWTGIRTLRKK